MNRTRLNPLRFPAALLLLVLPGCGLVRAPVRIASGVVRGTAELTEKAVSAPIDAHKRRKARRDKEKAETKAGEEKAEPPAAEGPPLPTLPDRPESADPEDFPALDPDLPPLPSEYDSAPVGYE